jgi:hypothetical protein
MRLLLKKAVLVTSKDMSSSFLHVTKEASLEQF